MSDSFSNFQRACRAGNLPAVKLILGDNMFSTEKYVRGVELSVEANHLAVLEHLLRHTPSSHVVSCALETGVVHNNPASIQCVLDTAHPTPSMAYWAYLRSVMDNNVGAFVLLDPLMSNTHRHNAAGGITRFTPTEIFVRLLPHIDEETRFLRYIVHENMDACVAAYPLVKDGLHEYISQLSVEFHDKLAAIEIAATKTALLRNIDSSARDKAGRKM